MSDSLNIMSGMGRLTNELCLGLQKRGHEIGHIGWFQHSEIPATNPEGIRCWFTNNQHYGADILDSVVNKFQPDVLLTIGDFWHLYYIADPNICRTRRFFQWSSYCPVDGEPIGGGLPPAIKPIIEDIDIPVAYTDYAKNAILKSIFDQETRNRIRTIYHGVDTKMFNPGDKKKRQEIRERYGLTDKFVFLTVCRNQSRKNIPELLRVWKRFSELPETKEKVILWPHMYFDDPMGWKIDDLLQVLELKNRSIMYFDQVAHSGHEMMLLPNERLAELYQIADAFVLLSGEGFGLPTFEAMATGLPCILLDHSASAELGAAGRADLVPIGGSLTWTGSHLTQRPVPDADAALKSFLRVYKDKPYRDSIARAGYDFATSYTWDRVLDDWHALFMEMEIPFMKPKKFEVVI
jgi:glycosyltransferase involved in cell wall biosynthesis